MCNCSTHHNYNLINKLSFGTNWTLCLYINKTKISNNPKIDISHTNKSRFFFYTWRKENLIITCWLERLTAFKRFRVNFESNNGCRYFFEKRSLITHFRPTNVEANTLCREANKLFRKQAKGQAATTYRLLAHPFCPLLQQYAKILFLLLRRIHEA